MCDDAATRRTNRLCQPPTDPSPPDGPSHGLEEAVPATASHGNGRTKPRLGGAWALEEAVPSHGLVQWKYPHTASSNGHLLVSVDVSSHGLLQ